MKGKGSHFKRALKILAKALKNQDQEEELGRLISVRLVGGWEGWTDEESSELWQIIDAAGSLDDSCPDGDDWEFCLSSPDIEGMVERLKQQLAAFPRDCRIVIEEYDADLGETIVLWSRP